MSILIYDGEEKLLYFNDGELFKVDYLKENLKKLSFQDYIREIDTCPDEGISWKKAMIIRAAEWVGMLRCV